MSDQTSCSAPWYDRLSPALVVLAASCAFSFGAIATVALADYHVNCVGHGFVHGSSQTDGSFHSRIEAGCGPNTRRCDIYTFGVFRGGVGVQSTSTCNAWSRNYGDYTECGATSHTELQPYFGDHPHKASNWCG